MNANAKGPALVHPLLEEIADKIEATEDAIEGDILDEDYVPRFSGMSDHDYAKFVTRAAYFNLVKRTEQALVGMLIRKPYVLEGEGLTFEESWSMEDGLVDCYATILESGRLGLLLDPTPEEPRRVVTYDSDDILNWGDGFVVLAANTWVSDPQDPFKQVHLDRRLVLRLVDGVYTAQHYVKRPGPAGGYEPAEDPVVPLFRGRPLNFIPFISVTPLGMDMEPVVPPLYDLARLNIQHFNTSLLIAYGSRFFALPKPWVAGTLAGTNADGSSPSTVSVGQEDVLLLNQGSQVGYLEFSNAGGMSFLASERTKCEEQMVLLGSRMLMQKAGVETVEALSLRLGTESAVLVSIVKVMEAAINTLLQWCQTNVDGKPGQITLNKDLSPANMSPEQVKVLLEAFTAGVVNVDQVLERLYAGEVVRQAEEVARTV